MIVAIVELAERFQPRRLNVATMVIAVASVALFLLVSVSVTAHLFALGFGVNPRSAAVLPEIFIARHYRRRSFGAISSVLDPFHKGGWVSARCSPASLLTAAAITKLSSRFV